MSVAAKTRLIELTISDGNLKKLFLVNQEKANAIEILLNSKLTNLGFEVSENTSKNINENLILASEVFPNLENPEKRPMITFRGIRIKTGLTQEELGARLGISQTDVSKIERGKRSIGKALAKKIQKEFKIDYRRFL